MMLKFSKLMDKVDKFERLKHLVWLFHKTKKFLKLFQKEKMFRNYQFSKDVTFMDQVSINMQVVSSTLNSFSSFTLNWFVMNTLFNES